MTWEDFVTGCIPEPRTIRIAAYQGFGAYGDVYDTPADVDRCVIDDTTRVVPVQTQDAEGTTAVSATTVFCPPGTVAPPGSLVTLPGGRTARVLATAVMDAHGLPLPEHVELALE